MADLQAQLHEDRLMRNAAKRLLKADVAFVKDDLSRRGLGGRIADRAKDGAAELADNATGYADNHRLQLGTGLLIAGAAFAGWIFRDRLADAAYDLFHDKGPLEQAAEKAEQLVHDARSYFD